MKYSIFFTLLLLAASCGKTNPSSKKRILLNSQGPVNVILTGVSDINELKRQAHARGVSVEGKSVLILSGDADAINSLDIKANENFNYMVDEKIILNRPEELTPIQKGLYLAKKDFGIFDLWKSHPLADGRGVTVGVLDDGISPHQEGFRITSTGERKFLAKNSQSTFTTFDLIETPEGFEAEVDENRAASDETLDLDKNGALEIYKIKVNRALNQACWLGQCKGGFRATGEYFTLKDPRLVSMIEIDPTAKKIKVFQPEVSSDSHGEGVASVMAGHRIGGLEGFDGVAPGSKILDYDLSEKTNKYEENEYTASTFLLALDWLGSNGAEVVNISYSFFFTSAETQTFMRDAFEEIIKKHNLVISFSAGNNGPGIGSLNRRAVYPESSLVAGAFVSKELDERVHGVTGIPEEGRVVHYSSRGPGLGAGPTLISPLSSLTVSSPDEGHRAFSGTSSASPALAGAAAVLISAIKQSGLNVHAPSVVHALRLSGKRLKAEPFIFQGNGLPQLTAALEIYKNIISGNIFENVIVSVASESQDGVPSKGLTIRTSQSSGTETRTVSLKGITSSIIPSNKKVNLLTPVRLIYSKGIKGPEELWVSSSNSNFYIDVDVQEVIGSENEAFGEIKVISQTDGLTMASVPVTIIKDIDIKRRPQFVVKVLAQEGKRIHLNVPDGIKAFKVRSEYIENPQAGVQISVFDTNQIRTTRVRAGNQLWVEVDRPGHYQVGISLDKGTPRGAEVRIEIEPIYLQLKTTLTSESDSRLLIVNRSKTPFYGVLNLKKLSKVTSYAITSEFKDQEMSANLEKGSYKIDITPMSTFDLSYPRYNCTTFYQNDDGKSVITSNDLFELKAPSEVRLRCMPFDFGMKSKTIFRWKVELLKLEQSISTRIDVGPGAQKETKTTGLTKGIYVIEVEDPLNKANNLTLGKIEVI